MIIYAHYAAGMICTFFVVQSPVLHIYFIQPFDALCQITLTFNLKLSFFDTCIMQNMWRP